MQISIIITCYNYASYVKECIESCLNQIDYEDYEVIFIDDGSSDGSLEVAKSYSDHIRVYSNPNSGVEYSSNYGIRKAKGKFFVRVDADDMLKNNYVKVISQYTTNTDLDFIYSEYDEIDSDGSLLRTVFLPDFTSREIRERGDFLATGTLFRKSTVQKAGLYSENITNCGLENFELMLKLLSINSVGICVHQPLFFYRRHCSNMSLTRRDKIISYGNILAKEYNLSKYAINKYHPYGLKI